MFSRQSQLPSPKRKNDVLYDSNLIGESIIVTENFIPADNAAKKIKTSNVKTTNLVTSTNNITLNSVPVGDGNKGLKSTAVLIDGTNNMTGVTSLTTNKIISNVGQSLDINMTNLTQPINLYGSRVNINSDNYIDSGSSLFLKTIQAIDNTTINITNTPILNALNSTVTLLELKVNSITSVNNLDDLTVDSLGGNIIFNTLLAGGVRMIGNPTNLTWIQNSSFQSGSNTAAVWGTYQISSEYRPCFAGHMIDGTGLPNAWYSLWLNFQQTPGSQCVIVGDTTSAVALTNGNAFYVTGPMECSGKLRYDGGKLSDNIATAAINLTNNEVVMGDGGGKGIKTDTSMTTKIRRLNLTIYEQTFTTVSVNRRAYFLIDSLTGMQLSGDCVLVTNGFSGNVAVYCKDDSGTILCTSTLLVFTSSTESFPTQLNFSNTPTATTIKICGIYLELSGTISGTIALAYANINQSQ